MFNTKLQLNIPEILYKNNTEMSSIFHFAILTVHNYMVSDFIICILPLQIDPLLARKLQVEKHSGKEWIYELNF